MLPVILTYDGEYATEEVERLSADDRCRSNVADCDVNCGVNGGVNVSVSDDLSARNRLPATASRVRSLAAVASQSSDRPSLVFAVVALGVSASAIHWVVSSAAASPSSPSCGDCVVIVVVVQLATSLSDSTGTSVAAGSVLELNSASAGASIRSDDSATLDGPTLVTTTGADLMMMMGRSASDWIKSGSSSMSTSFSFWSMTASFSTRYKFFRLGRWADESSGWPFDAALAAAAAVTPDLLQIINQTPIVSTVDRRKKKKKYIYRREF